MALAMALPRLAVIMSKPLKKDLYYVDEGADFHGFLSANGEEAVSPYAKFEVEMAKSGNGLVHIRSCYNNKYWVRSSMNHYYITAHADEPEEDQSKWSCTLFEPVFVASGGVRLRHVQLGQYARLLFSSFMLFAGSSVPGDRNDYDIFIIINWESILIFPKRIAFKGDNDLYLSGRRIQDYPHLQFASEDIDDPSVWHEVFSNPDGSIRIKSIHFDRFWTRSPNSNWVLAHSEDYTNGNPDSAFEPVRLNSNVITLRNLGNNTFCKRHTAGNKTSCLHANESTIDQWARLVVEELAVSRSVYNVEFRLKDARIYGHNVINMATGEATNATQEPNTVAITLSYTDNKSSTWSSSVSLKLGVKTEISTGIPFVAEGKIEISSELTGTYEWGEANTSSSTVETVFTANVPPMSTVKVILLATRASCEIPFAYVRRDTLADGTQTTQTMNDGIYTATNTYDFRYESRPKEHQ